MHPPAVNSVLQFDRPQLDPYSQHHHYAAQDRRIRHCQRVQLLSLECFNLPRTDMQSLMLLYPNRRLSVCFWIMTQSVSISIL